MAILVIGSGNIGGALRRILEERGEKVYVASRSGDIKVDISSLESVKGLESQIPEGVKHVVTVCGASQFGPMETFTPESWAANLQTKLIGLTSMVVHLVNGESKLLQDGGSITLTTGQAASNANRSWPGPAANNAGLEAFVRCAGLGMPRGIRLNSVSPPLVTETAEKSGIPTAGTTPAADVAAAFVPLIFGDMTGTVQFPGKQVLYDENPYGKKE
jgi:NAD(P)-dependent dehydrogenase (short-subunit alcohol dehydrogenase family)